MTFYRAFETRQLQVRAYRGPFISEDRSFDLFFFYIAKTNFVCIIISKQQTMFDHCIHAMTAEQTEVVMDLMERGPSPTCYDDMKTAYRAAYTNHG